MRIGANILVQAPGDYRGDLATAAAAIAVRSLVESDIAEHDLRLVVVANDCHGRAFDEWQRDILAWPKLKHVTVVPTGEASSFSHARNVAYNLMHYGHSAWDMFLEFDSDNVFPAVWFEPLMRSLGEYPRAGIFSPGCIMASHWSPVREPHIPVDYGAMHYSQIRHAVNAKAAECRKRYAGRVGSIRHPPVLKRPACLREIGLYDEHFQGGGWEDWDENMRAVKAGWEVRTFLSGFVFHWTAWEHVLLGGWQSPGGGVANRNYFFQKWPNAPAYHGAYLGARDMVYYVAPGGDHG